MDQDWIQTRLGVPASKLLRWHWVSVHLDQPSVDDAGQLLSSSSIGLDELDFQVVCDKQAPPAGQFLDLVPDMGRLRWMRSPETRVCLCVRKFSPGSRWLRFARKSVEHISRFGVTTPTALHQVSLCADAKIVHLRERHAWLGSW